MLVRRWVRSQLWATGLCLWGAAVVTLPCNGLYAVQEEDNLPTRPACNRILPEETIAYVRIRSMPDLIELYRENGMDQMMQDERLSNLFGDMYAEVQKEYDAQVKGELDDLELEQFQELFAGEMCIAVVAKRRQPMEGIMILDVEPETETFDKLMGVAKQRAEEEGRPFESDTEDDIEIEILRTGGDRDLFHFRQENTLYFSTNRDLCAEMIANLKGTPLEKTRQFVENRKYRTIMGQCRVDKDNPPLFTFFVDPLEVFKASTRGEPFAAVATGFFPVLGVDGLLGIGGAVLPGDEDFTALTHMHVLMSSPREGLLRAISFRSGDFDVPLSIPEDAGMMMVTSFDIPRLYSGIETIYNTFNGEDGFASLIERGSEEIGFDLKTELIDVLTGTLTIINRSDAESTAFNGASNAYLIQLNDPEKMEETWEKLLDRFQRDREEDVVSKVKKDGIDYWTTDQARAGRERVREMRMERIDSIEDEDERERRYRGLEFEERFTRVPEPAIAILDNQMVITDSREMMEHMIDSFQGRVGTLAESENFSLMKEKAQQLLGGKQPAGVMYNRPINQLSSIWNAIRDPEMIEFMKDGVQDQPFLSRLAEAYSKNELPPLEEMSDYFRTSGAIMTDDSTGLHFLFFEMKNKK